MMVHLSFSSLSVAVCILLIVAAYVYRALLPKPIPGIPYKKASANRILGDAPDFLKWRAETKEIWSYVRKMAVDLDSPIVQMFMRPLGKPWVIVTDFRESYDIQANRQHEFDRSAYIGEVFGPLLRGNHVWMPSNEVFRRHRHLIRDTMSPHFVYDVVGPALHESTGDLIALWRERMRLAQGRSFGVKKDIIRNLVDVIIRVTFGFDTCAIARQMSYISEIEALDLPSDADTPADFPIAEDPKAYTEVRTLVDSLHIAQNSPIPRQHLTFALNFYPSLVAARKWKDNMIGERLEAAWKKFSEDADRDDQVKCATDLLVQREAQMAKKAGRPVRYDTLAIRDELFGIFAAGHETTATTLTWAVKHLTKYQEVQHKLREALRATHKRAAQAGDTPTTQEIVRTSIPYLDAFIEENLRCCTTVPTIIRMATRDTVILGHHIPKGTDVLMLTNGPSYQSPAMPVDESKRSQTSQESKDQYGAWRDADIGEFKPERWLAEDGKGNVSFNPRAGPGNPFGFGLRGCFGVRLAVTELKIVISLIVWSFALQPVPESVGSFKADDMNTHRAQQVFVRLAEPKFN